MMAPIPITVEISSDTASGRHTKLRLNGHDVRGAHTVDVRSTVSEVNAVTIGLYALDGFNVTLPVGMVVLNVTALPGYRLIVDRKAKRTVYHATKERSSMPTTLYVYATPKTAAVRLSLDSGVVVTGVPTFANGRDDAHALTLPDGTPSQGGVLEVSADGCLPFANRGIVDTIVGQFVLDDVRLAPIPVPEPEVPPDPNADPQAIIQAVFELDDHDLATKEGCGEFTEACCDELHAKHSAMWGHIRKEPAQNQYAGHAVDALMLLAAAGETDAGIYDIIHDSESPNASPSFNYKGVPDPNLWYYPA